MMIFWQCICRFWPFLEDSYDLMFLKRSVGLHVELQFVTAPELYHLKDECVCVMMLSPHFSNVEMHCSKWYQGTHHSIPPIHSQCYVMLLWWMQSVFAELLDRIETCIIPPKKEEILYDVLSFHRWSTCYINTWEIVQSLSPI